MTVKEIKQEFFALRNGMVAEQLRKMQEHCPYDIVFGLMVPQIAEIARKTGSSQSLALELWDDCKVRESRLLACYLFDKDSITQELASRLISELQTIEEADMLAFRLLRNLKFAPELVEEFADSPQPLQKYAASMLKKHLERMA